MECKEWKTAVPHGTNGTTNMPQAERTEPNCMGLWTAPDWAFAAGILDQILAVEAAELSACLCTTPGPPPTNHFAGNAEKQGWGVESSVYAAATGKEVATTIPCLGRLSGACWERRRSHVCVRGGGQVGILKHIEEC